MTFTFLKLAYRHLLKNRAFSILNLFGLTLGFLCFIVIALYIYDELNYDRMHDDADRIYRIVQHEQLENGEQRHVATTAGRIGPESLKQLPEVYESMRITEFGRITMGNDPASRGYEHLNVADSSFFTFFDFKLIQGNPATALTEPNGIVISESLAIKYFETKDALGKLVWVNGKDMIVSGVMEDFPSNSHMRVDLLFSNAVVDAEFPGYRRFETSDWTTNSFATFIKLRPDVDKNAFEEKLTQMVGQNYPPDNEFRSNFTVQPLTDIHLYSANLQDYQVNATGFSPFYVYMFSVVAFLIVLIASLNYMNLSTAIAFKRTREIGTRKTLGAAKSSLIGQFLSEAILLSSLSLLMAMAILQLLLPSINAFTEKELVLSALPTSWAISIGVVLMGCAILASLYPAFVVARVSPVEAIKKEIRLANRSIPVRKVLVMVQFAISIIMISSTIIIYRQLNYVRDKELGFDVENLVTIDINSGVLRRQFESVKNEFSKLAEVQSVTVSSRVPGEWKQFPIASVNEAGVPESRDMIFVGIDKDFLNTYEMELKDGRNFTSSPADSSKVILTELAVEQLGLDNPIGKIIEIPQVTIGGDVETQDVPFRAEVIGVVEDFYFESFRKKMTPLVFAYQNNPIHRIDYYTLRIKSSDWDNTLANLKRINGQFDPINPVEYNFLDSKFEEFYKADAKRGQVFLVASGVIILIACMGLFALVSFSIENRKKEIGVRKVLGASVQSIVGLLSREFIVLIVIAFIIATPLVILLMQSWLTEFAYHVSFGVGTFLISGTIAVVIAFCTIGVRSLKAAATNPVESLRSE